MRHLLLPVLSILSSFSSANGQADYTVSYYPIIYKAEVAIVDNDLSKALAYYRTAFQSVDKLFAIDVVNATVCAIQLDSAETAFDLLHRLILKGISEKYLDEFKGFEKLRGSMQWADLMASYDSIRSSVQFKDHLFVQLDSLAAIDQKFRIAPGSYATYGDTIAKIDRSNTMFFRAVINQYGFPNEHILGAEYPGIEFPGEIVLHHHCQSLSLDEKGDKYNFESDFFYAVMNGELDPHRMAQLISMQGKYAPEIGQNTVIQLSLNGSKSMALREKVSLDKRLIIDENRRLAGLESQDDYFHKASFALFDPRAEDFEFSRYIQTEIYDCNKETYNKLIHAFEPLKQ